MVEDGQRYGRDDFMRLYLTYEHQIRGYIWSLVKHYADADDILQEAVAVLWKKYGSLDQRDHFLRWAIAVARLEVLKYYKDKRRQGRVFDPALFSILEEKAARTVQRDDRRRAALQSCLDQLYAEDAELIRLRYQMYATTEQVAHVLGRSVSAVYKALNKIHYQLMLCIRRKLAQENIA